MIQHPWVERESFVGRLVGLCVDEPSGLAPPADEGQDFSRFAEEEDDE